MESNVRVLGESIQQMGLRHFRSLTEIFKKQQKKWDGLKHSANLFILLSWGWGYNSRFFFVISFLVFTLITI